MYGVPGSTPPLAPPSIDNPFELVKNGAIERAEHASLAIIQRSAWQMSSLLKNSLWDQSVVQNRIQTLRHQG
jgi:hypothetical protein